MRPNRNMQTDSQKTDGSATLRCGDGFGGSESWISAAAKVMEWDRCERERDNLLIENKRLRDACHVFLEALKHSGYGMDDAERAVRAALSPNTEVTQVRSPSLTINSTAKRAPCV